jgi:hypothetical protein
VTCCGRRQYLGVKDVARVGYAIFIEVLRWESQTIGPIPYIIQIPGMDCCEPTNQRK